MSRKYTVPALVAELNVLISSRYPKVVVEGEVSQVSDRGAGPIYIQLRDRGVDGDVTLAALVWRADWGRLRHRPAQGERVACYGDVQIHKGRAQAQLVIRDVQLAGQGDLAKKIEAIKARLHAEGLLDPRRKRPLPKFPRIVGVATSPTGAAVRDFLAISGRRWPAARVLLASCVVQGPEAASSVIRAVELLIEDGRAEVIVVTRGGGSKEDLLPFQDEQLARFLANCPVPVVSAVGHAIDTTLADLVADVVAETPTDAANQVFPDRELHSGRIFAGEDGLRAAMSRAVNQRRQRVDALQMRLRSPAERLATMRQRLQGLEVRLVSRIRGRRDADRLEGLRRRLQAANPTLRLDRDRRELAQLELRLESAMRRGLVIPRLATLEARLRALSPIAILERGYAIVRSERGVVSDPAMVATGESLVVRVAGGEFTARVEG